MMIYICTKFHENILNGIRVMERTRKVNRRTDGGHDIIRPVFDGRIKMLKSYFIFILFKKNVEVCKNLVDRVYAVHGGSRGFDTCPNDFSDPIAQDIRTQCALGWKIVVTEWRSVTAVSLNVGGGVCLIKPANLYMCTQTHNKHDEDGRTAPGLRGHGSVPLSHSGKVVTRIGLHTNSVRNEHTHTHTKEMNQATRFNSLSTKSKPNFLSANLKKNV